MFQNNFNLFSSPFSNYAEQNQVYRRAKSYDKRQLLNPKTTPFHKMKEFHIKPKGLSNIGATCYMNATLQCFYHTKKLTEYLVFNKYSKDNINIEPYTISYEYMRLVKELYNKDGQIEYAPHSFKNLLGKKNSLFEGIAANDSKDLILFLIEELAKELKLPGKTNFFGSNNGIIDQTNEKSTFLGAVKEFEKERSIIKDIFYFMGKTESTCQNCKSTLYNFQVFNFIIFPLQKVYQDSLKGNNFNSNMIRKSMNNLSYNMNNIIPNMMNNMNTMNNNMNSINNIQMLSNNTNQNIYRNNNNTNNNYIYNHNFSTPNYSHPNYNNMFNNNMINMSAPMISHNLNNPFFNQNDNQGQYNINDNFRKKQKVNQKGNMNNLGNNVENLFFQNGNKNNGNNYHFFDRQNNFNNNNYFYKKNSGGAVRLLGSGGPYDNFSYGNINSGPKITLDQCFEEFVQPEYFTGENKQHCNKCGVLSDSIYSTYIYTSPNILILILNYGKGILFKCDVQFDEYINISKYVQAKDSKIPTRYRLLGAIVHIGPSSMGGHFIAFCRGIENNQQWYKLNDSIVSEANFTEIKKVGIPYVLFYENANTY